MVAVVGRRGMGQDDGPIEVSGPRPYDDGAQAAGSQGVGLRSSASFRTPVNKASIFSSRPGLNDSLASSQR